MVGNKDFPHGEAKSCPCTISPSGKVHLGLIPGEFFQSLYHKIGVAGRYMLITGLILCLSKEIFVITSDTSTISIVGLLVYVI